jgi:hypothetical protein
MYVAQVGLELLGSREPPTSVSLLAEITDVRHQTHFYYFLTFVGCLFCIWHYSSLLF